MGGQGYVPLRVHGWHSMLTGVDGPGELLGRAAELGCPALALTDLDGQAGMVEFLLAAKGLAQGGGGVRPIVGAELSDPQGEGRVVALVQDRRGYGNLCKLVSERHLGRDPGRFGADLGEPGAFDLARALAEHQEGLVLLVDHPRLLIALHGRVDRKRLLAAIAPAGIGGAAHESGTGPRNTHLAPRPSPARDGAAREGASADGRARQAARRAWAAGAEDGGEGIEDGEHGLEPPKAPPPARAVAAAELVAAARAVGVGIVAVPDVYCAREEGWLVHRARVAVKHNALALDLPESWVAQRPAHLLPFEELCRLYADLPDVAGDWKVRGAAGVPSCVARTLSVAETCEYVPQLGGVLLPKIELEEDETAYSKLSGLALEGARRRYRPLKPEVLRRLDYELTTIEGLGFAPYFLLVQKIRDWAAQQGIPCVGRGSAADSLVAYCLGLTDADPLRYRLIFERFLNPARRDRPDIDLDFCWRRRDAVIEHVYELFGAQRTAMISTLNTCGLRSAFRETALTEGLPPAEVNRWSRRLPHALPPAEELAGHPAQGSPLERALRATPELREFPHGDPRWRRVLRLAGRLEGAPRHFGLHPGGVVVAPGPITDFAACQRAAKGVVVTQLDKDGVEAIGLVKMDLLGNRALTVIDDCTRELRAQGVELDLERIPEDDPDTARTLREGRTIACFQVESPGMRNLLQQTGAGDMDAVIQAVALIRPGPAGSGMKDAYVRRFRGLEPPTPPYPRLTDVLWDTQGVLLYQEDVMQVAAVLAGMELAEADLLRRALQKRRTDELCELAQRFLAGCARSGVARSDAAGVWELVANFAAFGFCKAHAVTYGRISYRTVYLKTHFPALYLTAFLASHTGYYAERVYVEEARRLGVPILPPDVNRSGIEHAVEWSAPNTPPPPPRATPALRLGLGLVKGLSLRTLDSLLAARAARGPFLSLPDLLERSGARTDEAEALIQCGALDAFDRTRPELLWRLHLLRTPGRRPPRDAARLLGEPLDPATLAACRATPSSRTDERVENARATSGGWKAGLGGLTGLGAGESASLFPTPESPALALPALPDLGPAERGRLEWELLGATLAAHPTRIFPCPADQRLAAARAPGRPALGARPVNPVPCARIASLAGGRVTLRGWPAATRRVRTADGRWMRFLTLEDESGLAEAVLFPDVYERDGHRLAEFGTLCVTGIVQDQLGACTLSVERVW